MARTLLSAAFVQSSFRNRDLIRVRVGTGLRPVQAERSLGPFQLDLRFTPGQLIGIRPIPTFQARTIVVVTLPFFSHP